MTYWFEKARAMVEAGRVKRAGLLATQNIRGKANRKVLGRIKSSGDIFMAVSDREWVLEGAAVHVAFVAFDDGTEQDRELDGQPVEDINIDLTTGVDVTDASPLAENLDTAFMGDTKGGPFDIEEPTARAMPEAEPLPSLPCVTSFYRSGSVPVHPRPHHRHLRAGPALPRPRSERLPPWSGHPWHPGCQRAPDTPGVGRGTASKQPIAAAGR